MTNDAPPPLLSVVIAATDSPEAIDRALQALEGQGAGRIEVIVVVAEDMRPSSDPGSFFLPLPLGEAWGEGHGLTSDPGEWIQRTSLAPRHPSPGGRGSQICDSRARRIIAPPGSGVPRLRRLGLEASRGRVVAFLEDSCLASTGWAEAWISAFEEPSLLTASGVVEHADDASTLDWAVVFCEYAPFLPPTSNRPPTRLAGNNFAVLERQR